MTMIRAGCSALVLIVVLSFVGSTSAFVAPKSHQRLVAVRHAGAETLAPVLEYKSTVCSLMKKKAPIQEDLPKVDYGKIALQFVNPGNPYSWFLYMFLFIYLANAGK
jgi:hypothetical protein